MSMSPNPDATLLTCSITVRAIYPYASQGPDELHLQEGDVLELSSGINGGKNYADGWWEGQLSASDPTVPL